MLQLLIDNPWLIVCLLIAGVVVACTTIVFLHKSHQAGIDASLKRDMLNRGMSAVDIKTVLEACANGEAMRMAVSDNQGVRVGLGSFHVEVGDVNKPASAT